jgi:cytochrome P450
LGWEDWLHPAWKESANMNAQFDVNFFDGSYVNDPYPVYEEIRSVGRVVWNEAINGWMISGFDDCARILADKGGRFGSANGDPAKIFWFDAPNMIMVDGDEHVRLRSHLAPLFTRTAVAKWERRVRQVVDDLLQPLLEQSGAFELIADFTMIPTIIIADMLGIPEERYGDFRRWSHNITSNLSYGLADEAVYDLLRQTADELNGYMRSEVERRRREPSDDMMSELLNSSMTDEEIASTGFLLLVAGYDTTAKTMSNCVVALEQHPEQRKLIAENPAMIPAAVEEVMRWWGLLQMQPRIAVKDTEVAGTKITKGDNVYCMLAAANRDPSRWSHPEKFDVERELKSHVGFGYGPHLCLGAPLDEPRARARHRRGRTRAVLEQAGGGGSEFPRAPEHARQYHAHHRRHQGDEPARHVSATRQDGTYCSRDADDTSSGDGPHHDGLGGSPRRRGGKEPGIARWHARLIERRFARRRLHGLAASG